MSDSAQLHSVKPSTPAQVSLGAGEPRLTGQAKVLAGLTAVLLIAFAKPLYELVTFALHSELFSHILLIPFISGYLVWINKTSLFPPSVPRRAFSLGFFGAGLLVLLGYWFGPHAGIAAKQDHLTWMISALLLFFAGLCFFSLGPSTLKAVAFPLCFLIFMVPFPGALLDSIENFLQHTSAVAADLLFTISGTTFFRDELVFQLTGIRLMVAPECSGIHSTLVLFITSLIAGQLFLQTPWKRALLVIVVIPLGVLRNGFRIWTLGQLCIHISPGMIDSPIHHRGGPIFFALSLIPLGVLLYYLWKSDREGLGTAREP